METDRIPNFWGTPIRYRLPCRWKWTDQPWDRPPAAAPPLASLDLINRLPVSGRADEIHIAEKAADVDARVRSLRTASSETTTAKARPRAEPASHSRGTAPKSLLYLCPLPRIEPRRSPSALPIRQASEPIILEVTHPVLDGPRAGAGVWPPPGNSRHAPQAVPHAIDDRIALRGCVESRPAARGSSPRGGKSLATSFVDPMQLVRSSAPCLIQKSAMTIGSHSYGPSKPVRHTGKT